MGNFCEPNWPSSNSTIWSHCTAKRKCNSFVLTFDPKLFHSALDLGTFEADREGGKDEDADEENLSGVNLQKSAELEQLRLELGPQPQSCLVACSFALK